MFAPFAPNPSLLDHELLFTLNRKRKLEDAADMFESIEFPFSNLMRTMAARHHLRSHVLSVLSPSLGAKQLCKRMKVEPGPLDGPLEGPLDLSRVAGEEFTMDNELKHFKDITGWGVDRVVEFVSGLEELRDYAGVFRREEIDGACLVKLSLHHLTTFLGLKIGPAVKLLMMIHQKRKELSQEI